MFRFSLIWVSVALASLLSPPPAHGEEWDQAPPNEPSEMAEPSPGNGEVSVDIEGATPGLTPELFRATLSPHGDWYASTRYGSVWRPRVAAGWRPYFYGSWLWTDEGWYWDSGEPFAWAVYHYGRWVFDPAWGWVWVPGYQWAPAWVAWRFGVDVVGWAPLGPGVSVFVTNYPFYDDWWCFVPTVRFVGVPVQTVAYPRREIPHWFRATSPAPPRTTAAPSREVRAAPAWGGPSRTFIEERTGRAVVTERRVPAARPGQIDRERSTPREPGTPRPGERGPPAWTRPGRDESPGAVRPGARAPSAGEERGTGRPEYRPPGHDERRGSGRPEVTPEPRGGERGGSGRPEVRPEPRGGERGGSGPPEVRPEPRGEERGPPARAPANRGGDRRERRDGRGR
jgi:hypothetical protein